MRTWLFMAIFAFSLNLHAAGFTASLGFFPLGRLSKKTAEIEQTSLTGDIYLGYTNDKKNSIGVIVSYQYEESKQIGFSNPSDNQEIIRDRTSFGLALGHDFARCYVRLAIYGFSRWTDNFNTVVTTYQNGLGAQLDFGIPISINSTFYFAPQISIQTFRYQSAESGGVISDLSPAMTDTIFSPYLVFGFTI